MKTITIQQIDKISKYLTGIWMAEAEEPPKPTDILEKYLYKALNEITSNKEEQLKIYEACNDTKHIWWYERNRAVRVRFEEIGYKVIRGGNQ